MKKRLMNAKQNETKKKRNVKKSCQASSCIPNLYESIPQQAARTFVDLSDCWNCHHQFLKELKNHKGEKQCKNTLLKGWLSVLHWAGNNMHRLLDERVCSEILETRKTLKTILRVLSFLVVHHLVVREIRTFSNPCSKHQGHQHNFNIRIRTEKKIGM